MKNKIGFIVTEMMIVLAFTCACADGQNTEEITESEINMSIESVTLEQPAAKTDSVNVAILTPDLNRNGIAEEVRLAKTDEGQHLMIWEDYLLRYNPTMYQGVGTYEYTLSAFEDNEERIVSHNNVDFDINFGSSVHRDFDPETITVFMHELNELLSHSVQLLNTDNNLLAVFEKEGRLKNREIWKK